MKLSHDESRALGFIGLLLALSAGARLVDRPKTISIDAPGVDVAALESASRDLMKEGAPKSSRPRKPAQTKPSSERAGTPAQRERAPAVSKPNATPAVPAAGAAGPAGAPIRLNRATARELEGLPGVGPVLAARIIAYRDSVGGIRTFDQLDEVKGIGPAMLARLKPLLDLGT
jgi:competence protein ComEA